MFPFLVDINMTYTRKMQDGNKTPTLYSFYEDQYDFNDLSRRVDSGMNAHISTLKRGKKYEKEFREAVANIMSGIKDGTVTFGNGRFNDLLGRYSNVEDKDKDVYGWAANYVYNNMQNIPKYVKQDTSKKYDNTILGKALTRTIFGTDNGNIQYFWDVDPLDQSTNTRGIDQRLGVIGEAIQQMNLDNLLGDYSDSDRAIARQNLQEASRILQDGIQPGETLKLSRIFGGIDWNNWLRTDFNQQQSSEDQSKQSNEQESKQQFFEYIDANHPLYNGNLSSQILSYSPSNELEEFAKKVAQLNNDKLQAVPFDKLDNDSKGVYLDVLASRGLLPVSDGVFILPNTQENETVLTYDPKSRMLARKRTHELSYYRKRWITDYNQQYGTPEDNLAQYFTEFKKNGGVIKAQTGVKFSDNANWYTGVFTPQLNHIIQELKQDSNYYTWLNDMQDRHSEIYKSAGDNWQDTAYRNDLVGSYQDLYKSGYNNEWGDNAVGYNSLGIQNAQNLGMFDVSGRRRTSGDWNGNGNSWNTDSLYSAITDYRRLLGREGDYTPEQLAYATEQFKNVGYNFIKDANGYYKLEPIIQQQPLEEVPRSPKIGDNTDESQVVPVPGEVSSPNNRKEQFADAMLGLIPDAIGVGRLFASLRTNNRVANTLRKSLNPVLRNTYERYSPITGAFSEMQFRNRQAANLRRQASRPFTSDASLQLAGQLDADRQARDLEYQGFLADDREIRRTREAALARQEDNMARRSDVANFNRASINQTNREKAQLEATRLKSNWQSVDNFLRGMESRLRTRVESDRERRNNFRLQTGISDIETRYQNAIQRATDDVRNWQAKNPGMSISSMPNYNKYINFIREMNRWKAAQTYKTHANVYGYSYNNDMLSKTPESIRAIYGYRKGGSLKPSTMNLINKVIKNESYT